MKLNLRPAEECTFDAVSLGEVMLRLDPGEGRIRTARSFRAWEGGGEYNVIRGLHKCFGMRTAVITSFADNEVGLLMKDFIEQGGVSTDLICWKKTDGIGRLCRNGLNFTERGFGIRGAKGCSDRANTAISQATPEDFDFDYIFKNKSDGGLGVRWLHTGGIYAALSEQACETVIAACKAAKKYGTIVSYDLNYRPSMWEAIGGLAKAQEVNKEVAKYVDVMIGNEEDFTACLGFEIEGNDENLKELNLIIKADVAGSVEAVKQSLLKLSNEEVVVKCIHGGVGAINESDVTLASASSAIIIGFNVKMDATAKETADREKVDVRLYRVIYSAIEDVERAMKGMLDPVFEEKVIGHAEIRQIFKASGVGNIAGSYVLDGMFQRGCKVRISREGKQIYEGELASLKRFKDDVKEVKAGFECGLVFDKFNEIQELDMVEAYIMVEVPR